MFVKQKWRLKRHLCLEGCGESSVPQELSVKISTRYAAFHMRKKNKKLQITKMMKNEPFVMKAIL